MNSVLVIFIPIFIFRLPPRAAQNYPLTVFDLSHIISACSVSNAEIIILNKLLSLWVWQKCGGEDAQEAELYYPNLISSANLICLEARSLHHGITPGDAGPGSSGNLSIIRKDVINNFLSHNQPALPREPPGTNWYQGAKGYLLSKLRCKILASAMPRNVSPGWARPKSHS